MLKIYGSTVLIVLLATAILLLAFINVRFLNMKT
jgi:hypothetical protein